MLPNKKLMHLWSGVIYCPDRITGNESQPCTIKLADVFVLNLAEGFFNDIKRLPDKTVFRDTLPDKFSCLSEKEKSFWYSFAASIPLKLSALNLLIRPYHDFCRTCIITDSEIENLAKNDYMLYAGRQKSQGRGDDRGRGLQEKSMRFFVELNYLIPLQLKKTGFEIIRTEELSGIDENIIKRIAKAIHSRYFYEVRKQSSSERGDVNTDEHFSDKASINYPDSDFDNLPDEIKLSNLDNAYHIPTKLLAIGYRIRPVEKGYKAFTLHLSEEEIETMAKVEHLRWSWDKRLNGWSKGEVRDDEKKRHPGLIHYEDLTEGEKDKDRELVKLIPGLLNDIGYSVYRIDTDDIRLLSYALVPQSNISRLLNETQKLNTEIGSILPAESDIRDKIEKINTRIEEVIGEVVDSFNYARYIQRTFLPGDLFIRECFPDSFVFYKPKDIVSGDFYFFSKISSYIIFSAADCTGHGLPAALLSTISYGTLDQAVNELKITDPQLILEHLFNRLHKFLRRNEEGVGIPDDMDLVLCSLDLKTNRLAYSGINNPFLIISDGEVKTYSTKHLCEKSSERSCYRFKTETIEIKTGDCIYLFSDGFVDQFGGIQHKKYMSARFKTFLLKINRFPMPEQGDRLFEEFEKWRSSGEEEQTDDVLVIGIRL